MFISICPSFLFTFCSGGDTINTSSISIGLEGFEIFGRHVSLRKYFIDNHIGLLSSLYILNHCRKLSSRLSAQSPTVFTRSHSLFMFDTSGICHSPKVSLALSIFLQSIVTHS